MKFLKYSLIVLFIILFSLFIWGKIYSANEPGLIKALRVSDTLRIDHLNYWKFGYSAVMITNTAFYRNYNYHTSDDKLETLNIGNIGLVVDEVYRTLISLNE